MSTTEKMDVERVARTPDEIKTTRRELAISTRTGTLMPTDLAQALEFAQNMAKAETAVPKHLRGSPGACLAIIEYAGGWGMTPYGVANKSYVVSDRLCFESQLVHAVIKKLVPLKNPEAGLDCTYEGTGTEMKATISGEVILSDGTTKVLSWPTPAIKDIKVKNSPLWQENPPQQLFYRGVVLWQRRFFPELLLGIYTKDEMQDMSEEERAELARDVTPPRGTGLIARLPGHTNGDEGFRDSNVSHLQGSAVSSGAEELANIAPDVTESSPPVTAAVKPTTASANYAEQLGSQPTSAAMAGTGAPAADPTPSPSKAATPSEPQAKDIKDSPGYVAYLKDWLARTTDDARIHDRYDEEKADRTRCGVMGDDLKECQRLKKARLAELGSA